MKKFLAFTLLIASLAVPAHAAYYGYGGYGGFRLGTHSGGVFTPLFLSPRQWLFNSTLLDKSGNGLNSTYVESPCLTFGAEDYLTSTDAIPAGATIAHEGTAVLTISGNTVVPSTLGTAWNIVISDAGTPWASLNCGESSGATAYNTLDATNPFAITAVTGLDAVWSGTQDVSAPFAEFGGSKVLLFNGVDAYAAKATTAGITGYPFCLRARVRYTTTLQGGCVSLHDSANNSRQFYIGVIGGKLRTMMRNTGEREARSPLPYNDGEWHCVEGRFIAANNQELWVGDTWDTLALAASNTTDSTPFFTPTHLDVGDIGRAGARFGTFTGDICEASVYNDLCVTKTADYLASKAYGTTLPDSTVTNDATLVNTEFLYLPALADGTDDVAGLGITNPGGLVHNNGPHKLTNTDFSLVDITMSGGVDGLLTYDSIFDTKPFWGVGLNGTFWDDTAKQWKHFNTDAPVEQWVWPDTYTGTFPPVGIPSSVGSLGSDPVTLTYNELLVDAGEWAKISFEDMTLHPNFLYNSMFKWMDDCFVSDMLTWPIAYEWLYSGYSKTDGWIGAPANPSPTVVWDAAGATDMAFGDIVTEWKRRSSTLMGLDLGSSCTVIESYAFYFCSGLTGSLTIPDSVTSIESYAFASCSGLTNVDCYITKTIIDVTSDCFAGSGITTIHARSTDGTWTAGAGQTIGGKSGITVSKDLT